MTEFQTGVLSAMEKDRDISLVFITAPSQEGAEELARQAVEARLVACVNIISNVRSVYRWEGRTCVEPEVLLLAKTSASKVSELEAFIRQNHPYDTPEFVVLRADGVEARYGSWILGATGGGGNSEPPP